jgi:hypothetical protein
VVLKLGHLRKWVRNTCEVLKLVLEKISWTDRVRNKEVSHGVKEVSHGVKEVSHGVKEERHIVHTLK